MSPTSDRTFDPAARSWVAGEGTTAAAFSLQRLPYGAFSLTGPGGRPRLGVAIGDHVLDAAALVDCGLVDDLPKPLTRALRAPVLNPLLALSPVEWRALRQRLFELLVDDAAGWRGARDIVRECLLPKAAVRMHLPVVVGDYTDFYASMHHATNVGTMLRPDSPLLPNYRHVPIGYHGRASSIVVSGTPVRRPSGQRLPHGADGPVFGPSERLDYELEIGLVIGGENGLGTPVPIAQAEERVFGVVLLDDWSARDIQAWEYQPLGPFLAKSFATSIAAWVVPLDALADRRAPATARGADAPPLLSYLVDAEDQVGGALDLPVEVLLRSRRMREAGLPALRVSTGNARDLYWTPAQLVAHHTSNGCNLRPGDILGTGTVSGATPESRGCLLERTWRGTEPLSLPTGETRRFLEDGDEVSLASPLLASCVGEITPA